MRYILYRKRTFSDKFNLAFQWVRDNWRPLLKYVTLLLLPVSLLQGFGQHTMYSELFLTLDNPGTFSSSDTGYIIGTGLYYICAIAGGFLAFSLFFALLKLSFIDDKDLSPLTFREVWKAMTQNMGRLFIGGLGLSVLCGLAICFSTFLFAIVALIPVAGIVLSILGFVAMFFALVLLLPFFPIYLLTDNDFIGSVQESIHLGWNCYWGFLGTAFVMGILASVLSSLGNAPFFIFAVVKGTMLAGAISAPTVVIDFLSYVSSVVGTYVSYLASVLTLVIITIQYGHAADKIDGVSTEDEIENF